MYNKPYVLSSLIIVRVRLREVSESRHPKITLSNVFSLTFQSDIFSGVGTRPQHFHIPTEEAEAEPNPPITPLVLSTDLDPFLLGIRNDVIKGAFTIFPANLTTSTLPVVFFPGEL